MTDILKSAIKSVNENEISFCKFITPNDTGETGSNQAGYTISKSAWKMFLDSPGEKGSNKDRFFKIKWQNDFETNSRFVYYGNRSRNEYRITRFQKGFPYLSDNNIGDLLIISRLSWDYYVAFVLILEEEIEEFFNQFNISSGTTNGIITKKFGSSIETSLTDCFSEFVKNYDHEFPSTIDLAARARLCYNLSFKITEAIIKSKPDENLIAWLDSEFQLFKTIENKFYSEITKTPFATVEELVILANTILNRRKSRAGKSLEHHLSEIFKTFELKFSTQSFTEDNKKPDFIFPGYTDYQNSSFDEKKLVVLASKTTCKDRWRQILTEADRVKVKHLFTLQQGISKNQLEEMYKQGVCLVVPQPYKNCFPKDFHDRILSLNTFVTHVKQLQT